MNHKALLASVAVAATLAIPTPSSSAPSVKAPTVKYTVVRFVVEPPSTPCDADHIGDLEIIHGVWFECVCEQRVFTPSTCDWYEITSPAQGARKIRKAKKRIVTTYLRVVIA